VSKGKHIFLTIALTLLGASGVVAAASSSQKTRTPTVTAATTTAAQKRVTARNKKASVQKESAKEAESKPGDLRAKSRDSLVKATEDYKTSLQELLVLREVGVKRATEHAAKLKELYNEGLISRRELEENETALAEARSKVEEVRVQLAGADQVLAETLAELDALAQIADMPKFEAPTVVTPKTYLRKTAYVRYNGFGSWSLSEAGKVEGFFISQFGRRLPVSAFGQTDVHNRLGFDHRNAMDVGVHPDTNEGRALIAYLQSAGIPFLAFRQAIPGSATGPHIHIGRPSHRFTR
jgi:hypothetical protein